MKLSMNWLSDYIKLEIDPKTYSDRMTDTGSKVEGYKILGDDIKNVVAARLISVEKLPDSDHLWVCLADVGGDEPVQIVTGAQNVKAGDLVPAALHNAALPGGVIIKSGKFRGVRSDGMLCSVSELNLTVNDVPGAREDGILILKERGKPGDDIRDLLLLRDTVIDFEITPNRPDCLSVIGLARESAVTFGKRLSLPSPSVITVPGGGNIADYLSVCIEEPDLCPRYTARMVKNVKIMPSPEWMRARLRACGIRPINNIVDITNYVCLEYGQPMHAFDYDDINGKKITVRRARNAEAFTTLDGIERRLNDNMLVIADQKGTVAIAGVMGGENSEITEKTKTIVFESANFNGSSVRVSARDIGLRTESSARFEKGLDRENTLPAMERACELINLLGAGDVVEGIVDQYPNKSEIRRIPFNETAINQFLGTDIPKEFMLETLQALGIKRENGMVIPPSFRDDLAHMQDIAEEVIRIYGYGRIPSTRFRGEAVVGKRNDRQQYLRTLNGLFTAKGYYEIQTYSFISPKAYDKLHLAKDSPLRNCVSISNPLGEDTSVMRTSALANMLEALSTNRRHRNPSAALYEMAKIYLPVPGQELADEKMTAVLACYESGDFYTLKGLCEELLSVSGISGYSVLPCADNPTYHPGRCAVIHSDGDEKLMTLGQIHPGVLENFGLDLPVFACECDIDLLFSNRNLARQYKPLPKYPAITRDLAFVCDEALPAGVLRQAMIRYGGKYLESAEIFDVYRDEKLGANKKSVAYTLVLRAANKTLSDEEGDRIVRKILSALEKDYGVVLRG